MQWDLMLAHVAVAPDTEISLALLFLFALAGVFGPTLLGYWTAFPIARHPVGSGTGRAIQGLAAGVLLFLFVDFMLLTAFLGMGGAGGLRQLLLLALFLLPIIGLPLLEKHWGWGTAGRSLVTVWAVGIGLHSFSEGLIMGHNLTLGLGVALRVLPVASFVLHKFGEGVSGAALFPGRAKPALGLVVGLAAIAGLPAVVGVFLGYGGMTGALAGYFYALSAGVLVFVLPSFLRESTGGERVLWYAGLLAGFLFMYLTGVLHEI